MICFICLSQLAPLSKVHLLCLIPADPWGHATHIPYPVIPGLATCSHPIPAAPVCCPLDHTLMGSLVSGCGSICNTWFSQLWFLVLKNNGLYPPFPFWILAPSCWIPNLALTCQALVPRLCGVWPVAPIEPIQVIMPLHI